MEDDDLEFMYQDSELILDLLERFSLSDEEKFKLILFIAGRLCAYNDIPFDAGNNIEDLIKLGISYESEFLEEIEPEKKDFSN